MTDTPKKIKIPVDKLDKLIEIRTQVDENIKKREAKIRELTARRRKAEGLLVRYVNKDEGTQSHTTNTMMCYASVSDFYTIPVAHRAETNLWVLEPLREALEACGEVDHPAFAEALSRLGLFKNEVNSKYVDQFRIDNGAEVVSTGKNTSRIDFGDLPDGVNMHREPKVNFRKLPKK